MRAGGRLGAWNGEAGRGDSRAGDRETPGLQNLEAASTNMAIMAEQGVGRPPGCRTWRQRQRTWRIRSADRRRATAPGAGERRSNGSASRGRELGAVAVPCLGDAPDPPSLALLWSESGCIEPCLLIGHVDCSASTSWRDRFLKFHLQFQVH